MRTVYKYPIYTGTAMLHTVPQGEPVLCALDPASGAPCLWYEVNTDQPQIDMEYETVGTGQPIPDKMQWIGSCVQGDYIWHIYGRRHA
jgi:hypothetical protein